MIGTARIGCSGWVYPDWKGLVYPDGEPQHRWLELYAERFDTVEINATFYRLPTREAVEGWADAVPDDFVFAAKLGQFCTHRKKLKDPEQWLPNHLDRIRRLGSHLGPNLIQLPPRWRRNVGRLDEFLEMAPDDIDWAVEVRDASWLHDELVACLREHGAALCIHDLLADHPWELTADWTYVRFHGPAARDRPYLGRYGPPRLEPIALRLAKWLSGGVDVWAYFNNDYDGNAVVDAEWLRGRLGELTGSGPA